MVTEPVLTNLRQELQTISAGTTQQFLDEFSPIHVEWHNRRDFNGDNIGVLSFHHEVILAHADLLTRNGEPVQGEMRRPRPPYRGSIDVQPDAESFSNAIEDWHNSVHMNPIYPEDFMDPAVNIYMDIFWQFHTLIDNKFTAWLSANGMNYDDVDHTVV